MKMLEFKDWLIIDQVASRELPLWILKQLYLKLKKYSKHEVRVKLWQKTLTEIEKLTKDLQQENKGVSLKFFDVDWYIKKNSLKVCSRSPPTIIIDNIEKIAPKLLEDRVKWAFEEIWKKNFKSDLLKEIDNILNKIIEDYLKQNLSNNTS